MVFTFEQQHGRNWNTSSATTTPSPTTTINRTTTSTMINSSNTTTTIIPTLPPPSYQHNHHHHTNTTTITPPTPRPLPCFNHHYTTTITTTTIKPYNKRRRSSWTHGLYEYTAFEHLQMCLAPHDYTVSRNSEWLDTFRVVVVDFRVLEQSRESLWRRSSISVSFSSLCCLLLPFRCSILLLFHSSNRGPGLGWIVDNAILTLAPLLLSSSVRKAAPCGL